MLSSCGATRILMSRERLRATASSEEVRRAPTRCLCMYDFPTNAPGVSVTPFGKVLVTGGAGAIGSNLVDELVLAGAEEIVILDNFVRGRRENIAWAVDNGPVRVVDGDIRDRDLVRELMSDVDVLFHQAAIR